MSRARLHDVTDPGEYERLLERYERERRVRLEAESIAESATRRLYEMTTELERSRNDLEQMYASQRDFIAIASHELQTPIAPITGFAATLLERWDEVGDAEKLEWVRVIDRQARRLAQLAGLLLAASRIEAGRLTAHPRELDVGEAIARALESLEGGEDVVRPGPRRLLARGDPDLLHQMLINVLRNAQKYGRPPVAVEASDAGRWVEIRVRDSGPGVPEDLRPRLFEKFAKSDIGRANGTGLGLFIVRGLARAQSGDAWYEPDPSGGACFGVRLPKPERAEGD